MTDLKEQARRLIELDGERTQGEWRVRPHKHDDWGMVRGGDESFPVAIAREGRYLDQKTLDAHRSSGIDPAGHNSKFITHNANYAPAIAQAYLDQCEVVERLREEAKIGILGVRVIIKQIEGRFRATVYDNSGRIADMIEAPTPEALQQHWINYFPRKALGDTDV